MERVGTDIWAISPTAQTVTSTFAIDIRNYSSQNESDSCGLGWRFQSRRSQNVENALMLYFRPGFFNIEPLGTPGLAIDIFATQRTESIGEPCKFTVKSSSQPYGNGTYLIGRYHLQTSLPAQQEPFHITFTVNLPPNAIPSIPFISSDLRFPLQPRPKLQDALHKALRGDSDFKDVRFSLFSRRLGHRNIGGPRILYGNRGLLSGCNDYLDDREYHSFSDSTAPYSLTLYRFSVKGRFQGRRYVL
jgi:hypothetical protein